MLMSTKCVRPRGAAGMQRGASSPGRCASVTARRSRRRQPRVRTRSGRAPAGAPCAGACLTLGAKPRRDRASPRPRHLRNAPGGGEPERRRKEGARRGRGAGGGGSATSRRLVTGASGRRAAAPASWGRGRGEPGAGGRRRAGGQGRRGASPLTAGARGSRGPRPAAPRARTPPRARPGGGSLSWRGDGCESLPGAGTKMAPRFPASPATPPRQLSPASAAALPASAAGRPRGACRYGAAGRGAGVNAVPWHSRSALPCVQPGPGRGRAVRCVNGRREHAVAVPRREWSASATIGIVSQSGRGHEGRARGRGRPCTAATGKHGSC